MAHHSLRLHPKLDRLVRALRVPLPHAVGLLDLLWWQAYLNPAVGPDGQLAHVSDEDVAFNAGWPTKTAGKFVEALCEAGFLERTPQGFVLHDYADWVPDFVKKRWQRQGWTRSHSGEWRRSDQTTADNGGQRRTAADEGGLCNGTRPDPVKPNIKKPGPVGSLRLPNAAGNPRQTRAGPEFVDENGIGPDRKRARRKADQFRSVFAARICNALGLNGQAAVSQRASLYAVARNIEGRADCSAIVERLVLVAAEKRDAGLDKPIAAWQKAATVLSK